MAAAGADKVAVAVADTAAGMAAAAAAAAAHKAAESGHTVTAEVEAESEKHNMLPIGVPAPAAATVDTGHTPATAASRHSDLAQTYLKTVLVTSECLVAVQRLCLCVHAVQYVTVGLEGADSAKPQLGPRCCDQVQVAHELRHQTDQPAAGADTVLRTTMPVVSRWERKAEALQAEAVQVVPVAVEEVGVRP